MTIKKMINNIVLTMACVSSLSLQAYAAPPPTPYGASPSPTCNQEVWNAMNAKAAVEVQNDVDRTQETVTTAGLNKTGAKHDYSTLDLSCYDKWVGSMSSLGCTFSDPGCSSGSNQSLGSVFGSSIMPSLETYVTTAFDSSLSNFGWLSSIGSLFGGSGLSGGMQSYDSSGCDQQQDLKAQVSEGLNVDPNDFALNSSPEASSLNSQYTSSKAAVKDLYLAPAATAYTLANSSASETGTCKTIKTGNKMINAQGKTVDEVTCSPSKGCEINSSNKCQPIK